MKCVNCDRDAVYTLNDPGFNTIDYCNICLPRHLHKRAESGQLRLREAPKSKSKAPETVDE